MRRVDPARDTVGSLAARAIPVILAVVLVSGPALALDAGAKSKSTPAPNEKAKPAPVLKWASPEQEVLAPPPAAPEVKAANDDYYSRRAQKILESERRGETTPHPLAAAHPDKNVVVCVAGCSKETVPEIVYMEPKNLRQTSVTGEMIPTSSDAALDEAEGSAVECVGGCYDEVKAAPASAPKRLPKVSAVAPASEPGPWETTIEPDRRRDHLSPIR